MITAFIDKLYNLFGWSTEQQLFIMEVDDFGTVRIPDPETFNKMKHDGIPVGKRRFSRLDTLESARDLENLFDILSSVKDSTGRNAVLSPMFLVANPDFTKILESDYTVYYYETFPESYYNWFGDDSCFKTLQQGIGEHLFAPEFHGREHLNVRKWMKELQEGNPLVIKAFEYRTFGFDEPYESRDKNNYMVAFEDHDQDSLQFYKGVLNEGLKIFRDIFGYSATLFTPPNGIFPVKLEKILAENQVKAIVRARFGRPERAFRNRWICFPGKINRAGLMYQVRNCVFEPSLHSGSHGVEQCLNDINKAFAQKKPAIISSHRVNYVSGLDPENSVHGLRSLKTLLDRTLEKWPDVRFLSSAELINMMLESL